MLGSSNRTKDRMDYRTAQSEKYPAIELSIERQEMINDLLRRNVTFRNDDGSLFSATFTRASEAFE